MVFSWEQMITVPRGVTGINIGAIDSVAVNTRLCDYPQRYCTGGKYNSENNDKYKREDKRSDTTGKLWLVA